MSNDVRRHSLTAGLKLGVQNRGIFFAGGTFPTGIDPERLRNAVAGSKNFSKIESDVIVKALDRAKFDYRSQFGAVMLDFSSAALQQINQQRQRMKAPIHQSRRDLLKSLDEGYANLRFTNGDMAAATTEVMLCITSPVTRHFEFERHTAEKIRSGS